MVLSLSRARALSLSLPLTTNTCGLNHVFGDSYVALAMVYTRWTSAVSVLFWLGVAAMLKDVHVIQYAASWTSTLSNGCLHFSELNVAATLKVLAG